jgi:hypothetical protein
MSANHLRQIDSFARVIVAQQTVVRRTINWLDLFVIQLNWMYLFIFVLFTAATVYLYPNVIARLLAGQGFTRQESGVILLPFGVIGIAVWGLLLPYLKWHRALVRGRIAVAVIQSIQAKERGEQGIYDVRITWTVYGAGEPFRAEYKETTETRQLWMIQAKVGDRIVVLVDPVKPKVLEAVGPVDAEPRVAVPTIPESIEEEAA